MHPKNEEETTPVGKSQTGVLEAEQLHDYLSSHLDHDVQRSFLGAVFELLAAQKSGIFAVQYKEHRYDAELVIESDYIGDPTPESDQAWHVLLENMNIAVPASDLKKIHAESISVPGEPGMFVAGLSVYHELHCLKRLRQHTWSEHYLPNQTTEDMHLNRLHTDHCIDVLRQAILCRADVALFTMEWSEDSTMPRADFSHEHQCVDWEGLNAWAGERAIPDEKMASLQHPTRGAAFLDGKGSISGASLDHSATVAEDHAH